MRYDSFKQHSGTHTAKDSINKSIIKHLYTSGDTKVKIVGSAMNFNWRRMNLNRVEGVRQCAFGSSQLRIEMLTTDAGDLSGYIICYGDMHLCFAAPQQLQIV